jgi:phage I-like protein
MKDIFIAMNVQLVNGAAPEWVQLLPPGPKVRGRDGRYWYFGPAELQAVLNNFEGGRIDLPIDREHSTDKKGANGEEAPAAAWIVEVADRNGDGGVWGRVDWTERGRAQVEAREYRYLSPVFYFTDDLRIVALDSAGLTNKPNLHLTALNRQVETMEDDAMKKALCRKLGLPETATEQEIQAAVAKIMGDLDTANNRAMSKDMLSALGLAEDAGADAAVAKINELASAQNHAQGAGAIDITKLVPRADLEMALNRAETAEKALKDREATELEGKIEVAVNRAIQDGKIAPASKDFYVASCRKEGGLKEFEDFAKAAPQVIEDPQMPDKPEGEGKAMNQQQAHIAEQFGNTAEDLAKYAK